MSEESDKFSVGQKFDSDEILKEFFHRFCEKYFQPFVIRSCSKHQMLYKCCHGRKRPSKSTGKRPNQHYFFKGCEAQINLYKGKNSQWKVTKVNLCHNHSIGANEFSLWNRTRNMEKHYDLVSDLVRAGHKDSIIAEVVRKKTGKLLTRKDVQNIRNKLFSSNATKLSSNTKVVEEEEEAEIQSNSHNLMQVDTKDFTIVEVVRKKSGKLFKKKSVQNIRNKLFISNCEDEEKETYSNTNEVEALTYFEKFNMVSSTTKEIVEIMCNLETKQFLFYLESLKIIRDKMKEGLPLGVKTECLSNSNPGHSNNKENRTVEVSEGNDTRANILLKNFSLKCKNW